MTDKERLIDYLYGEMTVEERAAFEEQLRINPSLKRELDQLSESRTFLAELPDVQPPAMIVPLRTSKKRWLKWGIAAGIAASIILLLDVLNFQIRTTEKGLALSFGEETSTPLKSQSFVALEDVRQLLKDQESAHQQDLERLDSVWQNRILAQEKENSKSNADPVCQLQKPAISRT